MRLLGFVITVSGLFRRSCTNNAGRRFLSSDCSSPLEFGPVNTTIGFNSVIFFLVWVNIFSIRGGL
jgi:hypothetical protein